jgi:hypothetical protein
MRENNSIDLPKIIQGPQAARINAMCCVPKGEGLPLWAVISMTVDSAASISTLKKALHAGTGDRTSVGTQ